MINANYRQFKDFADQKECPLDGEKRKISEIVDKKILIIAYRIRKSKIDDGNYVTIQFSNGDNKVSVFFTGSRVLMEQCERYKDQMPFYTTILQKYKYYTMT